MRFLHTADLQLGLRRRFLPPEEAGARYFEARFEAAARAMETAVREGCELAVVAGDVFESNRVDRRTVLRGIDALAGAGVAVYLLPGNHDALGHGSVYRSPAFLEHRPGHLHVLDDEEPVEAAPGVEVVGAPWRTKRPGEDLVARLAGRLEPAGGKLRIAVAHGAVDVLSGFVDRGEGASPDRSEPSLVRVEAARRAIDEGRFHYLALGDRHSVTEVAPRIWYPGSPEVTDFVEERSGRVLVVELDEAGCRVEERPVGRWRFVRIERELGGELAGSEEDPAAEEERSGLAALADEIEAIPDKVLTALRLELGGQLPLHLHARLAERLDSARDRFAALEEDTRGLVVLPDRLDRDRLALSGFAAEALARLEAEARGEGGTGDDGADTPSDGEGVAGSGMEDDDAGARTARAALSLLYRLLSTARGEGGEGGPEAAGAERPGSAGR